MKWFISGIDTDSGKSIVTGLLAQYLLSKKQSVITQKWVQTGCTGIAEDILTHRKICNKPLYQEDINGLTCSYVFKHPASPHLSAQMEQSTIDTNQFKQDTQALEKIYDFVLMEGAGGLMVPLNAHYTSFDYVKEENYNVILVSSSKLGSINHTLLSLELLQKHNIKLSALIYNQFPNNDPFITQDTETTLQHFLKQYFPNSCFISLPCIDLNNPPTIDFSELFKL